MKRPFFDASGKFLNDGSEIYLGIPNNGETFNRGLGMWTKGTRDAERKAKALGLVPVGDSPIEKVFQKKQDDITPILVEGMKKVRAQKAKEGKL